MFSPNIKQITKHNYRINQIELQIIEKVLENAGHEKKKHAKGTLIDRRSTFQNLPYYKLKWKNNFYIQN